MINCTELILFPMQPSSCCFASYFPSSDSDFVAFHPISFFRCLPRIFLWAKKHRRLSFFSFSWIEASSQSFVQSHCRYQQVVLPFSVLLSFAAAAAVAAMAAAAAPFHLVSTSTSWHSRCSLPSNIFLCLESNSNFGDLKIVRKRIFYCKKSVGKNYLVE